MGKLTAADKRKVQKPLLWIGLASIVMTFAGLTSGYVVSRSALLADNRWLIFGLPPQFLYATIIILVSSLTMILAKMALKKGQISMAGNLVLVSLFLGVAFFVIQIYGAQDMIDRGFNAVGVNTAVSWVYVIAGLHWLHLFSGLIVLLYTWYRTAIKKVHTATDHQGFSVSAIYWHFLDGLWLYLYLFLLFIR
ncbi:cytochrome c oxidase subunit 3 [Croceimicrobium hydrocarbonivorans]|uniref:Cytochrome c oxidase subunit 3 n=1 Tax=Croceimicrobium hydrocarbonivorans TaxID=2761580 RepID=A0A7H0VAW9_9FLAO|nr:cytochrome c oxidase subunit 3 [Croceimicrobium hydrocarbonivorans]QNR22867.1 cytochrome c oxidase subunit 3 [Croceimicrobium hydrocarbonivorans]